MSVEIHEQNNGKVLTIKIRDKLHKADYELFIPRVERLIERVGKIRLLIEMSDFHGWDAGALWQDIKFDMKHFSDIERIAFVGDKIWEKGMSIFCKPFTVAKVKYFEKSDMELALAWIDQGISETD